VLFYISDINDINDIYYDTDAITKTIKTGIKNVPHKTYNLYNNDATVHPQCMCSRHSFFSTSSSMIVSTLAQAGTHTQTKPYIAGPLRIYAVIRWNVSASNGNGLRAGMLLQSVLGITALRLACQRGKDHVVQLLLNCARCDPNARSTTGRHAAIHIAAHAGRRKVFDLMKAHPRVRNTLKNGDGKTADQIYRVSA
jgi:hypothetical protein